MPASIPKAGGGKMTKTRVLDAGQVLHGDLVVPMGRRGSGSSGGLFSKLFRRSFPSGSHCSSGYCGVGGANSSAEDCGNGSTGGLNVAKRGTDRSDMAGLRYNVD